MASFAGVYACALAILMLRPRNGNDATLALWHFDTVGTLSIYLFFHFSNWYRSHFSNWRKEGRKVYIIYWWWFIGSGEKEGIGMIEVDGDGWWLKLWFTSYVDEKGCEVGVDDYNWMCVDMEVDYSAFTIYVDEIAQLPNYVNCRIFIWNTPPESYESTMKKPCITYVIQGFFIHRFT